MNPFSLLSLLSVVAMLLAGGFIYSRDTRSSINALFLAMSLVMAYSSFAEFQWREAETQTTARTWVHVASFWPFSFALLVHFALVFTEAPRKFNNLAILGLLYGSALAISLADLTTGMFSGELVLKSWGWDYAFPENYGGAMGSAGWAIALVAVSVAMLVCRYVNPPDNRTKQQTKFVLIGMSIPLAALLVWFSFWVLEYELPDMSSAAYAAGLGVIAYAVSRYQLFSINQGVVAEEALAGMSDALFLVRPTGRITNVNDSASRLTGRSRSQLSGEAFDTVLGEDGQQAFARLAEDRGARNRALETTLLSRDDRPVPVAMSMAKIRDVDGEMTGIVCIATDLTDRRRSERELREANQRLEAALGELREAQGRIVQQERLGALGLMASGIAHDLNNALAPILGHTETLLAKPSALEDPTEVVSRLRTINTATKNAAATVRRLREFYRPRQAGEVFDSISARQLLDDAVELTTTSWKDDAQARGVSIQVETVVDGDPAILGNQYDLREGLVNLILNSVDALPAGGRLELRARSTGDEVVIDVQDNGVGMTDDIRERCLEPFYTTKGERGTGLGLATTYGTVQRHEGSISIESSLGQGTTISMILPASEDLPSTESELTAKPSLLPISILVVDDEVGICELLAESLGADGHSVETANTGAAGLEMFRANHYDLVVLDRAMPGMNGDQLAAAIKHLKPDRRVIMLTGFGEQIQASGEQPESVDLVLSKPVTRGVLRQAMADVMSGNG